MVGDRRSRRRLNRQWYERTSELLQSVPWSHMGRDEWRLALEVRLLIERHLEQLGLVAFVEGSFLTFYGGAVGAALLRVVTPEQLSDALAHSHALVGTAGLSGWRRSPRSTRMYAAPPLAPRQPSPDMVPAAGPIIEGDSL
jgi:hypothetical protein